MAYFLQFHASPYILTTLFRVYPPTLFPSKLLGSPLGLAWKYSSIFLWGQSHMSVCPSKISLSGAYLRGLQLLFHSVSLFPFSQWHSPRLKCKYISCAATPYALSLHRVPSQMILLGVEGPKEQFSGFSVPPLQQLSSAGAYSSSLCALSVPQILHTLSSRYR